MVAVKIECECGQHYAFDVEPVNGRMPAPVSCPACGVDGSAAANEYLAQRLSAPVALASPPPAGTPAQANKRVSLVAPAAYPSRRPAGLPLPGQPDRNQILFEARAKISWGDSPQEVLKYLMINGLPHQEASEFVNELFNERAAVIRANGIKYIFGGALAAFVPIGFYLICLKAGVLLPRTLVVTIAIGLFGLGLLIKGLFMVFAPKSASGDMSEQ